ncbi:hypothetical protein M3Y98_01037000 [Aphelenchoides besseyi]|nr:hypothetical protein M3Y98_01037000 [Aphelenchoides besseyi]
MAVLSDSAVVRDQIDSSTIPSLPTAQALDLSTSGPETESEEISGGTNSAGGEVSDALSTRSVSENNDDVSTTTAGIRTIGTTRFFPLNQHTHNGNGNLIGILADKEEADGAKSE